MKILILFCIIVSIFSCFSCTQEKCIECKIGTRTESYCEPDQETLNMQKDAIEANGGTCK